MLLEALEYATTPAEPWARKLGYLTEAIALRHRARRCRSHWAAHQAHTKAAILDFLPARTERITVLGAGLCLDVPMEDLAERCETLVLVDAVRLRGVRLPPNARFEIADIDGTVSGLDTAPDWSTAPGHIVSVNVISQLPLLPCKALAATGRVTEDALDAEAQRIKTRHIALLREHGAAVLIGDLARTLRDPDGAAIQVEDLAADCDLPDPLRSWNWPLIPLGEAQGPHSVENTVGVWTF